MRPSSGIRLPDLVVAAAVSAPVSPAPAAAYGARADQARRSFSRLDQDRNGVLDAAELTTAISQFFASRDRRARGNVAFGYL